MQMNTIRRPYISLCSEMICELALALSTASNGSPEWRPEERPAASAR